MVLLLFLLKMLVVAARASAQCVQRSTDSLRFFTSTIYLEQGMPKEVENG